MKADLLIKNATVLLYQDGKIIPASCSVGSKAGKIVHIGSTEIEATEIVDARGLHLLPGVIDSQVHFREPGLTHKEDLETGTKGALLGGVTSIFEMPNTVPSTTTRELLAQKFSLAKNRAWVNYAFFVGGSPENVDQLAELELTAGCPGIKIFMGSSTGSLLVEDDPTLEKIFRSGRRRVILHSEDEPRIRARREIVLKSKDVHDHPVWRDVETALTATKRLVALSKKTGRKVHVLHVTTADEMQFLKNNKGNLATVEVLPQHLTLHAPDCYDRLGTYAQQNPPIRDKQHQDALWRAIQDGTVDVIGSDHAPHTREEKNKEYPQTPSGMPSVQTLVPIMLNHVNNNKLSLERFVELVCENPRRVFGCRTKGRIEVGLDADFTLVDMKKQKTIQNSWIASRSGWTPFDGMKVQGWPIRTILAGKTVMADDQAVGLASGTRVDFFE